MKKHALQQEIANKLVGQYDDTHSGMGYEEELIEVKDDQLYSDTVIINESNTFEFIYWIHNKTRIPLAFVKLMAWTGILVLLGLSMYQFYTMYSKYQIEQENKNIPHEIINVFSNQ